MLVNKITAKKQTHYTSANNLEDFIGKYTAHAETHMLLIKPQTKLKPYNNERAEFMDCKTMVMYITSNRKRNIKLGKNGII